MSKREIVSTEELMNHEALLLVHGKKCYVHEFKSDRYVTYLPTYEWKGLPEPPANHAGSIIRQGRDV